MKVKFSKAVEYTPSYNGNEDLAPGDQFKADLRVLSTGDLLMVMDALQESGVTGNIDTEQANVANMKSVIELVPALLPKYVTLRNLFDGDGNPISVQDVIDAAFFLPLQVELLLRLSVISTPSEDAEKNLRLPLDS